MPANSAFGHVVVHEDNMQVRTLMDTRRGAIVNWLVTNGTMVMPQHTDADIEKAWKAACAQIAGLRIARVEIKDVGTEQ